MVDPRGSGDRSPEAEGLGDIRLRFPRTDLLCDLGGQGPRWERTLAARQRVAGTCGSGRLGGPAGTSCHQHTDGGRATEEQRAPSVSSRGAPDVRTREAGSAGSSTPWHEDGDPAEGSSRSTAIRLTHPRRSERGRIPTGSSTQGLGVRRKDLSEADTATSPTRAVTACKVATSEGTRARRQR
jgi:hypothetical protein